METLIFLLYPVIEIIRELYKLSYFATLDVGWAIILLSVLFNTITLPLYYVSEKYRKAVKDIQNSMLGEVKSIKQYYSGRERHFYIKAVQRMHGFRQSDVLKSSIGLLLQIPFFLAVFLFISGNTAIIGQSFGPITDLSSPDTLLFGWPVLPWCMLIANLLSSCYYRGGSGKSDNWQLWLMALVFFVLLYGEASALLLYWTVSNIYSLVKNLIERFIARAPNIHFKHRLFSRFRLKKGIVFTVATQTMWIFLPPLIILDLCVNFLFSRPDDALLTVFREAFNLILVILLLLYIARFITRWLRIFAKTGVSTYLYGLTLTALLVAVFIINPLLLYTSTDEFALHYTKLLSDSVLLVISLALWITLIYSALHPFWRGLVALITAVLLASTLMYSFVMIKDYGLMTQFTFDNQQDLRQNLAEHSIEIVFLGVLVMAVFKLLTNWKRAYAAMLVCAVVAMLAYVPTTFSYSGAKTGYQSPARAGANNSAPESYPMHSYSRDKNVLVLILDGFSGSALKQILGAKPHVFDKFTGFVWYENTLSRSFSTWSSILPMVGGEYYSVRAINNRANAFIRKEVTDAYAVLPKAFIQDGWQVSYYGQQYANLLTKGPAVTDFNYGKYYLDTYQPELYPPDSAFNEKNLLYAVSIFRSAPLLLKYTVYADGKWLGATSENDKLRRVYKKAQSWGFLRAMETAFSVQSIQPTLKLYHLEIPHPVNLINANGFLQKNKVAYIDEATALIDRIHTLLVQFQMAGVYDSTKIILISDHGYLRPTIKINKRFPDDFLEKIKKDTKGRLHPNRLQPLLMVKDFNAGGAVQTSQTFMSNSDLLAIICSSLSSNCHMDLVDPTKTPLERELSIISTVSPKIDSAKFYDIRDAYKVRNNIFDPANWEKIDPQQLISQYRNSTAGQQAQ